MDTSRRWTLTLEGHGWKAVGYTRNFPRTIIALKTMLRAEESDTQFDFTWQRNEPFRSASWRGQCLILYGRRLADFIDALESRTEHDWLSRLLPELAHNAAQYPLNRFLELGEFHKFLLVPPWTSAANCRNSAS
jgi:hypothetical protein